MQRAKVMSENRQYAASILNPPFSFAARQQGMKSLGRAIDLLGAYEATRAFVMRPWASRNVDALERYIAAYVEATRWARESGTRAECVKLLSERLKLGEDVAERTYEALMGQVFGLAPDARFSLEGCKNMLVLRAEIEGQWGGKASAPDKHFELGYYQRALARLVKIMWIAAGRCGG
jgi:chorismate mutase